MTILASPNLTPGIGTSVGIADSTTNIVSAIVVSNASVVSLLTSNDYTIFLQTVKLILHEFELI